MKLPPGYVPGQGPPLKPSGYGGFGERMLRSMGWEKGQGLGRNNDGIKEAIEVKKKEDTVGIGGNASWNWQEKYWETAYESVQLGTQDDSDSSSDDDSSDDEGGFGGRTTNRDGTLSSASAQELRLLKALSKGPATGRFGGREAKMARIREQEAKLAAEYAARLGVSAATTAATTATTTAAAGPGGSDRSETTSEVRLPSGSGAAGAACAAAESAGASEGSKKRKRDKRTARSGGGEATAAEGAAGPAEAEAGEESSGRGKRAKAKEGKKRRKGEAAAAEADAEPDAAQQAQQQQGEGGEAAPAPRQRIVIEPAVAYAAPLSDFKPTPTTGWWGAARFVSAGSLEGAKKDVKGGKDRMTFNEADQERVYMAAHNNQVKRGTKKGLGQSQAVGPVGGAKWAGSRVTFQDEEEGGKEAQQEAEEAGGAGQPRPKLAAIGSSTQLDSLARPSQAAVAAAGAAAAAAAGGAGEGAAGRWEDGIKWRKLITKALESAGGQLKLKDLQRQVAAEVLARLAQGAETGAEAVGKKEVRAVVAARAAASSRFALDGKVVRLAKA